MSRADLDRVREWAIAKLSACQEPLCTGHPYIKLLELVDTVLVKMNSDTPSWDGSLRLVEKLNAHKLGFLVEKDA